MNEQGESMAAQQDRATEPSHGVVPSTPALGDASTSLGAPVAHLTADRLCTQCHHNLVGQPVYRESRYGLVVARCPECGGFTPMLEYPTLGRWGRRLGAMVAALLLTLLVIFMLGGAGVLAGWGYGVTQVAPERVNNAVYEALHELASGQPWRQDRALYDRWVSATGGIPAIIESNGGLLRALEPATVYPLAGLVATAVVVGVAIAIFVPGQRGLRLALVALLPCAIATLYMTPWALSIGTPGGRPGYWGPYAGDIGRHVELPVMLGTWGLVMIPTTVIAALIGRRVARTLVRMFLPPRHRLAFLYLWSCDGRSMTPAERGVPSAK